MDVDRQDAEKILDKPSRNGERVLNLMGLNIEALIRSKALAVS
jgi:hypothetical protein